MLGDAAFSETYYINYGSGNNTRSGLTAADAWKHAPGDPLATGRPAAVALKPGDVVRFRGSTRYRGKISVRANGLPGQPITFDGSLWGTTRAIMDGSTVARTTQPCPSQAFCNGAPNWQRLHYVSVPVGTKWHHWVFSDDKPYSLAQYPMPDQPFAYDDVDQYLEIPESQLAALRAGRINRAGLPAALQLDDAILTLWEVGNKLHYVSDFTIDADGISFSPEGHVPYSDRPNKFSIMNTAYAINKPGQFAIDGGRGIAIVWPHRAGARISVGTGNYGFFLNGADHVTIRGFTFANYAGDPADTRSGVPVFSSMSVSGITLLQNIFRGVVLVNGYGVANFNNATDLVVAGNTVENSPFSSGFRIGNSAGPVTVSCNRISDIGRTGIMMQNIAQGVVRGNYISRVNGIHGNAIAVYMDNRDVQVTDNVVVDSIRPLTLSGEGGSPFFADASAQRILIARNTMTTNDRASSAITSWGGGLDSIVIDGNTLGGPAMAVRLNGRDGGVSMTNNRLVGTIGYIGEAPPVTQSDNTLFSPTGNGAAILAAARSATVAAGVCG